MIIKKMVAAKGMGRKRMFTLDNILALIFVVIVLCYALINDLTIFAYFCMGMLVGRIFEIIFEIKEGIFDKPFLHYLLLVGMPAQWIWSHYFTR